MKFLVGILVILVISGIFLLRYVNKFWDRESAHMDAVVQRLDDFDKRFNSMIHLDNAGEFW